MLSENQDVKDACANDQTQNLISVLLLVQHRNSVWNVDCGDWMAGIAAESPLAIVDRVTPLVSIYISVTKSIPVPAKEAATE